MLFHHPICIFMRHIPHLTGMDHPLDHNMTSNHTQTCSSVTLVFRIKSLNHGPHQWCSSLRTMTQVWICYPTVNECYMRHELHLAGVDHLIDHHMTTKYTPDILSYYPGYWIQELEPWSSSVLWWSKDNDAGMDMVSHHFMNVI